MGRWVMDWVRLAIKQGKNPAVVPLFLDWPHIVGQKWSRSSAPERLIFARGEEAPTADLVVSVWGGGSHSMALSYEVPALINRLNKYLGFPLIKRIILRQKPLPKALVDFPRPTVKKNASHTHQRLAYVDQHLPPSDLADALTLLGNTLIQEKNTTSE